MELLALNGTVISQTGNTVLVMGELLQVQQGTDLSAMFVNDEEFIQRLQTEGFDLSGTDESNETNWGIVNSWTNEKKIEFMNFFMNKMSEQQLLEVYDRIFFGNTKN